MPHLYLSENEKLAARRDAHRKKVNQESMVAAPVPPVADIPSQAGNLAMQGAHNKSVSNSKTQNKEDLSATPSLGHGGDEQLKETPPLPQKGGGRPKSANPGGRGLGRMQHAGESFYEVTGSTLSSITSQLHVAGGFAAETNAPIGMAGRVRPNRQADGTIRAEIVWQISGATTTLPRWVDYDGACPAAQAEWDRFMGQTRAHEQAAHVDAARAFVSSLGPEDTVITGASVSELQQNLEAKHRELAGRLQAIHDACTHGRDIDAILHPDNGRCE